MAKSETDEKKEVTEAPKKGKRKGMFLIILIIAFLALSLGAGGVYVLFGKKMLQSNQASSSGEIKPAEKQEQHTGPILSLDPFLFNIYGSNNKFAKVTIGIQLKDEKVLEETKKMVPLIRDRVLSVLGTKGPDVLIDVNSRTLIKEEVISALKAAFKEKDHIKAVYITDIIIQ